ncbi:MAG: hypothetical protein AAB360_03015 [Patescibacteria group bacterium]
MPHKIPFIYTFTLAFLSVFLINLLLVALNAPATPGFGGTKLRLPDSARYAANRFTLLTARCNNLAPIRDLARAGDPAIRKLAEYQAICNSAAVKTLLISTDIPKDESMAQKDAECFAEKLKEFESYNLAPIVLVEPISDWGIVNLSRLNQAGIAVSVYDRTR